jgi:antitoxin VapB
MAKKSEAKLFQNGRSQAVRLPREFRFEGDRVRIKKTKSGVLLEPVISDVRQWFAAIDGASPEPILKSGRKQPRAPRRKMFR